jgi:hypothetical protein
MADSDLEKLIDRCIELFRNGELSEQCFLELRNAIVAGRPRQHLLYLQAETSGLESQLLGMSMVLDGKIDNGPANPDDWPYKSVLAAIQDGWRVIWFPDLATVIAPLGGPVGAGCEFILEKWE